MPDSVTLHVHLWPVVTRATVTRKRRSGSDRAGGVEDPSGPRILVRTQYRPPARTAPDLRARRSGGRSHVRAGTAVPTSCSDAAASGRRGPHPFPRPVLGPAVSGAHPAAGQPVRWWRGRRARGPGPDPPPRQDRRFRAYRPLRLAHPLAGSSRRCNAGRLRKSGAPDRSTSFTRGSFNSATPDGHAPSTLQQWQPVRRVC